MTMIPTITTARLTLNAFTIDDAPATQRLVSERELARYTLNIPHPYPSGGALAWINGHAEEYERGESVAFAIRLRSDRILVGCVGLRVERRHDRGELGYWIGLPFWGRGYATEAAHACLDFVFERFALHKVVAIHDPANQASGRVLSKLGMTKEGVLHGHLKKGESYLDCVSYGLIR